ncbi:hypothetical protein CTheo_5955 [Ceratobasidium theobromae]|uniref:Uncharacterized protein n=1 Tax=Ceratobasidium theobromae TaxID=1582974 RepID=A0A5N5QFS8_9AGAM|nr:hypothetical protein CTheo_5955 [Ceratobasidium theobromae]
MQELDDSTNNQRLLPISSPRHVDRCRRHPEYYFKDGSAVFRAGKCLFKLQASLLAADSGVKGYEFEKLMKNILNVLDTSISHPYQLGASDDHPIVLPGDVSTVQFAEFLCLILSKPGDENYMPFLAFAQDPRYHHPKAVAILVDTGSLAVRFGMNSLDRWIQSQLKQAFNHPSRRLDTSPWNLESLLPLISYMQMTRLETYRSDILIFVRYILCKAIVAAVDRSASRDDIVSSCGVFASHQSPIWTDALTRDDRTILYAAHIGLTKLSDRSDLDVSCLGGEFCKVQNFKLSFTLEGHSSGHATAVASTVIRE